MSNPTTTERVTAAVAEHPGFTQPKLALAAGVSRSTVSTVLAQLVKDGVVVATRPTVRGATTYTLAVADAPAPAETDKCEACELGTDAERGPVQTYDDLDGAYHQDCAEEIQAGAAYGRPEQHATPTVEEGCAVCGNPMAEGDDAGHVEGPDGQTVAVCGDTCYGKYVEQVKNTRETPKETEVSAAPMTEEDVPAAAEAVRESKTRKPKAAPKPKAEPKRKPLPEGYVSVMGLTHEINKRGLYKGNRADGLLTGQAMYTYINANRGEDKAHQFPITAIEGTVAIPLEEGIQWWTAKDERVAAKAKAKAQAAAAKASKGAAKKPTAKKSK